MASAKSLAKRLAESLTESLTETLSETLDETFGETLGESLTKSLAETLSETLDETFGETLGETFRARQAFPQNLGSDYMNGSPQESLRDSFFYAGRIDRARIIMGVWVDNTYIQRIVRS